MVVDDSAVIRSMLKKGLSLEQTIEVIALAKDPYEARELLMTCNPDVMILDIAMPKMDGITFLRKIMKHRPTRVIILSALLDGNTELGMKAIEIGALEVVTKPRASDDLKLFFMNLIETIKAVAEVPEYKIGTHSKHVNHSLSIREVSKNVLNKKVIAIGASTGGIEALGYILMEMPEDSPPIVIVQHLPEKFTRLFAERLNKICKIQVKEAEEMEMLTKGKALIAPGDYHMIIKKNNPVYYVRLNKDPFVHHQRPAVDKLFDSVSSCVGSNAIGVLLTGMGSDGAKGLLRIRNAGGYTIAQDEQSSIVYGMPGEAKKIGAAMKILTLKDIAGDIVKKINET